MTFILAATLESEQLFIFAKAKCSKLSVTEAKTAFEKLLEALASGKQLQPSNFITSVKTNFFFLSKWFFLLLHLQVYARLLEIYLCRSSFTISLQIIKSKQLDYGFQINIPYTSDDILLLSIILHQTQIFFLLIQCDLKFLHFQHNAELGLFSLAADKAIISRKPPSDKKVFFGNKVLFTTFLLDLM